MCCVESYDEPFGNSSAIPTLFCARLAAQHGKTHLLAGDGGDELFAGNERYETQQLFDYYSRIPDWMKSVLIEPVFLSNAAKKFDVISNRQTSTCPRGCKLTTH